HRMGMRDLEDTVPRIIEELEVPNAHAVVRLAVARALIALDARQAAPVLMRHAEADGLDTARVVEPALARWNYAPMQPTWSARLIAATLLAHHRGRSAEALLLQLAGDHDPTVAVAAGRRLLEIDPVLLKPLLNGFVKSPDTGLRQLAAGALALLHTPEAVALL